MKVYQSQAPGTRRTALIQPVDASPKDHPAWFQDTVGVNADGKAIITKAARTIPVLFVDGVADVDDDMGAYMLRRKLAHKKPQPPLAAIGSGATPLYPGASKCSRKPPIAVGRPIADVMLEAEDRHQRDAKNAAD